MTNVNIIPRFPAPALSPTPAYTHALSMPRPRLHPPQLPFYLIVKAHLHGELNFVRYHTSTGKNGINHQGRVRG